MKIAVFGGSGSIGRALLPELVARGHSIRAMQHRTPVQLDDAEVVEGSIGDPDAVAATIGDADVVLQLTKGGQGIEQAVETSVRGTINVLDAIRAKGGVDQYLLTSSDAATGICSHPYTAPIDHETPPISYGDYYSLGKMLEERIVLDYDRNDGLRYTIARLSWTQREDMVLRHFIAGDNRANPTAGVFRSGYTDDQRQRLEAGEQFVAIPCDDDGRVLRRTLVQLEDTVAALLAMVGAEPAAGERFHVSGPAFDYDRPARYLADRLDLPAEPVYLDGWYPYEIDVSHTTDLLGWEPRYDVFAMIDAALAWRADHAAETG
ncbi:MAG: NAD-dependent epimerase/dehydratase family protein [bacterium]